jgi:hypothetical protein
VRTGRHAGDDGARLDVLRHHRPGADEGSGTDPHAAEDDDA